MDIRLNRVSMRFGPLQVFDGYSDVFREGTIYALLGPSGCGKTTLLNLISGLLVPDAGSIEGVDKNSISYLYQEPRLLPWKSVSGNLDLVLRSRFEQAERKRLIDHFLSKVGLGDFTGYYPDELSGGMRQRTAIARAFVYPSTLLLMDEPFQALDLRLKLSLTGIFLKLWQDYPRTTLFVTHDIQEALMLGQEILVFQGSPGRIASRLTCDIPPGERSLQDDRILKLEKKLYGLLSSEVI